MSFRMKFQNTYIFQKLNTKFSVAPTFKTIFLPLSDTYICITLISHWYQILTFIFSFSSHHLQKPSRTPCAPTAKSVAKSSEPTRARWSAIWNRRNRPSGRNCWTSTTRRASTRASSRSSTSEPKMGARGSGSDRDRMAPKIFIMWYIDFDHSDAGACWVVDGCRRGSTTVAKQKQQAVSSSISANNKYSLEESNDGIFLLFANDKLKFGTT